MSAALALLTLQMTCEEFYEYDFEARCDSIIQEMYWDDSYSTETLYQTMCAHAAATGVVLTDAETWSYDRFFHNVWKCTEKGLS